MYNINLKAVISGYDRETCWVQARAGAIPGNPGSVVMTMQKLSLSCSDVFFAINEMRSDDGGATWSGPYEHSETLGRRKEKADVEAVPCDFTPKWHTKSGKLLGTGHVARYSGNELMAEPRSRDAVYSVYDQNNRTWSTWNTVKMPEDDIFFNCGAGSAQRWDCDDGTILLPIYTKAKDSYRYKSAVVRCAFDGEILSYIEHGDFLECPDERGLYEPSIIYFQGRYFLTMRNDLCGYVATSRDGLHWSKPKRWDFDNGIELGNYNTQQHWVIGGDKLYLTYTRRCVWNNHVFRHRAPIFMAEVNLDELTIKRNTERIIISERGARLGNFQPVQINDKETWIVAAEWMQNDNKGFGVEGAKYCEQFGSDNTVWIAEIVFS